MDIEKSEISSTPLNGRVGHSGSQLRKTLRDVAIGFLIATTFWSIPIPTRDSWPSARHCMAKLFGHHHPHHHKHHHHHGHKHGHHQHNLFPSGKSIGFQGPTEIGKEPFVAVTGPVAPTQQSYFPLVSPVQVSNDSFDPLRSWGYLSPFHSLPSDAFGLSGSSGQVPGQCRLTQVHLLHRHGARYPTSSKEPSGFGARLNASTYKATANLEFLNDWKYSLGKEVLTPFGRSQLFNLGVGFRQKYGDLVNKLSDPKRKLVFRTTSQHRMLHSALNFAAGFFGVPFKSQYHQSIMIEAQGYNNTLAPYYTCNKSEEASKTFVKDIMSNWTEIYLAKALPRLQANLSGYQLTFEDVLSMQKLCAYETVSLGWSDFCQLFTPEEFKGFAYHSDLMFWYAYSFGSPTAAAIGKGWVEELVSRLTQEHIKTFDSSTNSTLVSNPITFPLDQPIYVDATHDTVISCVIVALNLTTLTSEGPLPTRYIPEKQSFVSSHISPFAGNLQAQVVECEGGKKIRFLLNDAPVPLTGLNGCPQDDEGFCPLSVAIKALQTRIKEIDHQNDCNSDISYSPPFGGGGITDGRPPSSG
ncbi:hypothetical protein Pst134EA_011448 [Puccinia striiformis f. sp. tritici]|uniref:hypothetical protein n=1 Tax=Puccinia striiformis f. sp. tritici TaxID=168172 RepID=UPI002008903B|nr:hypothetical protein Pst134EA_011448 [Puccinia striiformis f. sp. tritici]KAH9467827.1 hypothetical protein Pst134EA_011448 [Puccinia striiformis f. sp. tritici]